MKPHYDGFEVGQLWSSPMAVVGPRKLVVSDILPVLTARAAMFTLRQIDDRNASEMQVLKNGGCLRI